LHHGGGVSVATNSIFWGNTADTSNPEINGTITATYCDVEGSYSGAGNIDLDPYFVDPYALPVVIRLFLVIFIFVMHPVFRPTALINPMPLMLAMMGRTLNLIRQLMILMATAGRKVADSTWVLMNITPP